MDYVAPLALMEQVREASRKKAALPVGSMLLKGFLSGAFLAYATTLAFAVSGGLPPGPAALVAGAVFPVGFAMIVLLGLELATGNFAVLAAGVAGGSTTAGATVRNWAWVTCGNLLGSVVAGALIVVALTGAFGHDGGAIGDRIASVAASKTLAYEHAGARGWATALVKGVLCNWMVAIGTILGLSSTSSAGKIASIWLPVSTFFALGYEHSIVNMFVIPSAMMLGSDIGVAQWLLWNQLPVTVGNILGGAVLTGLLLHHCHRAPAETSAPAEAPAQRDVPEGAPPTAPRTVPATPRHFAAGEPAVGAAKR